MADERDCFAVAMPHETDGHFSVYLSLFGRDLPAGKPATAHARLQILRASNDQGILAAYDEFVKQFRK